MNVSSLKLGNWIGLFFEWVTLWVTLLHFRPSKGFTFRVFGFPFYGCLFLYSVARRFICLFPLVNPCSLNDWRFHFWKFRNRRFPVVQLKNRRNLAYLKEKESLVGVPFASCFAWLQGDPVRCNTCNTKQANLDLQRPSGKFSFRNTAVASWPKFDFLEK